MPQRQAIREGGALAEPPELAASVSYRIRMLQIMAYKAFEQKVADHGSAPRYYGLLKLLHANPGVAQARLAEAVALDRSSLVPIIETLTREGWVERRRAVADKRVRQVHLTEEGARKLAALEIDVQAHEAMLTEGLSVTEKARLLTLLARVDGNLRAAQGAKS